MDGYSFIAWMSEQIKCIVVESDEKIREKSNDINLKFQDDTLRWE